MKQLHGHEVINLIVEANKPLTLDEIKTMADNTFGTDTRYYTCSASDLNTEELLEFLMKRNKLIKKGDGYVMDAGDICDDE